MRLDETIPALDITWVDKPSSSNATPLRYRIQAPSVLLCNRRETSIRKVICSAFLQASPQVQAAKINKSGICVPWTQLFGQNLDQSGGGWVVNSTEEVTDMLWTIFVILLVMWLLGLVSSYTLGGYIHILLVIAVVVLLINLITGRRPAL